ncbi:hypothetical protein J2X65_004591 [Ancylobacter sp. 3268]|uniref:helix-turn-helix domain-containing protein n=1 Tax=Ancylobacter sp. 3268 TaxID=2817752 RepID=UPI0028580F2C|nr:hypothetical protein [Ancylobacter sp. 3268]MDR6955212.1 hypothetical protein [Ancylobacter sp. 3268]
MTPAEMQAALATLDLSPAALAKLLGVDVRTARRWATGGKPIPDTVAAQVSAMVAAGGVPVELVEQRRKVEPEVVARFLWVRRKGEPEWTVAEHDLVADVFYLPGRVERYRAVDLVLGPAIEMPT